MADREAVRRLIEQAYAARGRGDVAGILADFHAEASFELVGDDKLLVVAGATRGHSNLTQTLTQLCAAFEFTKREYISFLIDGDRAAVHSRVTIRFVPKNHPFTTDMLDLFTIRDGKIVELIEFADTALIKHLTSA
ncbi:MULTISPECIES: nuclear transport factor 2 family protein [unclassified Bradyrhizobium]|uniref:nuclear transport factor 2 family protein n=1 Tax=unclassified Bradyrhizobium TaxID=2631580 RepID=UPI00041F5258|nr:MULTISPECIES: nuclear transport factor 2 family protein [unclassified Bradyrhizobium]QIG96517.1 nuclear transport factor 2 family protein [Bradyrhizobium sp. 6(2017)]